MAKISRKSIQEIKETVRISDVFEWLGARVVRKGRNTMAFCPFCEDANSKSPGCSLNDELGLFHCFAAGTLVATKAGNKPIEKLMGEDTDILNGDGKWETVSFKSYGRAALWHLRLMVDGEVCDIFTTSRHRWFVQCNGKLTERYTQDLLEDDELAMISESGVRNKGAKVIFCNKTARTEEVYCCQTSTGSFALACGVLTGNCFVCQESGDTIAAVMQHEEVTFPEAIELIADKFNIELSYDKSSDPEAESRRKKLISVLETAQSLFLEQREDLHFEQFLSTRNITMDTADRFGLGMSLYTRADAVMAQLQEKYSDEEICASGLAYQDEDTGALVLRFKNRLMFPIKTASGALVGFGGRDLTGKSPAKYKNSPESEVFKKRDILYGMDIAKKAMAKSKRAIVCEGHMDTIALQDHGFPYAVGAMGTALTTQNLRKLSTFADTIYISLDSDEAGVKAAMRTADTMPYNFASEVKVLAIPEVECRNEAEVRATSLAKADEYLYKTVEDADGSVHRVPVSFPVMVPMAKDPDEFFNQVGHTQEEFAKIIAQAEDLFLFCAKKAIEKQVMELDAEVAKDEPDLVKISQIKMEGKRNIDDLMAKIYHKANIYQRQNIANYIIAKMRLIETTDVLESGWSARAASSFSAAEAERSRSALAIDPIQEMGIIESDLTEEEDLLIATLYFHPEVRLTIRENIDDLDKVFTSETRRSAFSKLDEGYGKGLTAKQATDELMGREEIKELGRIVMNFDADEESARELSADTIIEICKRIQRHAIENAIEMESQAASPDVMKIIDLKMQLAKYND